MERSSVEKIAEVLAKASVRYLVAGGVAVVAHGHVRFTADLDLVLDPDPEAIRRAVAALSSLGYRPIAPVPFEEFSSPDRRREWIESKGLTVFSVFSPEHKATEVDLFVEPPFEFDAAYARALRLELGDGTPMSFVSLADLIAMKRQSGRPHDLEDIARLADLSRRGGGGQTLP